MLRTRNSIRDALCYGLALAVGCLLAVAAAAAPSSNAVPTVAGPISGGAKGHPVTAALTELTRAGYIEQEYFIEGEARTFAPKDGTALTSDGLWDVTPTGAQKYKTRLLVRRPVDPKRFNGTVVVEWLQSHPGASFDKDVYWIWAHNEMLRDGFAWVGVSADRGAVDGHPPSDADRFPDLVHWDPQRYGSLDIPNEDMGYDIFTQVGRLVGPKRPIGPIDPLGGLRVKHVISGSASASTEHVVTYIDAVQPIAGIFEGFVLHARMDSSSRPLTAGVAQPAIVRIRSDLKVPVIVTNNEDEAFRHYPARQPDSPFYRLWETAAAPHTNAYWNQYFNQLVERDFGGKTPLCAAGNDLPNQYVENAALSSLNRWVGNGTAPPHFDPIAISGTQPQIQRGSLGEAQGGLRLPQIVVPLAKYSTKCPGIFPLAAADLAGLYKGREDYQAKFQRAVADARKAGFLMAPDAEEMLRQASQQPFPVASQ